MAFDTARNASNLDLFPTPQVHTNFGGFRPEMVFDPREEQRLKDMLSAPSQINLGDAEALYRRRFGQEEELTRLQQEQQARQFGRESNQVEQDIKGQLAQRGLGFGTFAQSQAAPALSELEQNRQFQREAMRTQLGDIRASKIEGLKSILAREGMQRVNRQFQNQFRDFQRAYGKYQKSTQRKFALELEATQERLARESENAWGNMALEIDRSKRGGGIAGGIIGGIGGAVAAYFTGNPALIGAGISAGRGLGSSIGTGLGSGRAGNIVTGY